MRKFIYIIILFSILSQGYVHSQCEDGWIRSAGNSVGLGLSLDVDDENNFYGIGVYNRATEFEGLVLPNENDKNNIYFYKRNPDGSLAWLRFIEGHFSQIKPSVLVIGDQLIVSSSFLNTANYEGEQFVSEIGKKSHLILALDLNGNLRWTKQFNNLSIVSEELDVFTAGMYAVDDNSFLITGNIYEKFEDVDTDFELESVGFSAFLIKISKSGEIIWGKCSTGSLFARGWSVSTDNDGNILMSGMTNGDLRFDDNTFFVNSASYNMSPFVAKFDPDGNNLWVTGGWCPNFGTNYDAQSDNDGNIYVGGGFTDQTIIDVIQYSTRGINDAAIFKYDPEGELIWIKKFGAIQQNFGEYVTSIEVFDDYLIASGIVVEGAKFDQDNYLDVGLDPATRYFIAKYDLDGNLLELNGAGGNGLTEVYETVVKDEFIYTQGKYNGLGMFGNDTIFPVAGFQDSFSSAAFQWKFKFGETIDPIKADFEFEETDEGLFNFTSTSTGSIDEYSWSFGLGYEQQFGENIQQNFYEEGQTEVCLTVSNCFTRQINCQVVDVTFDNPPLVPVSYARLLKNNGYEGLNVGKLFELRGVVHGNNFSESGLDFYLLDNTAGINVKRSFPVEGYKPAEGDSLHIVGEIEQYLGQLSLVVEEIEIIETGQAVKNPKTVLEMSEANEGSLIELRCCTIIDTVQWLNDSSGFSVDVSSDLGEFKMKLLSNLELILSAVPEGSFNVSGLVGQESFVTPSLNAYFLLPRYLEDFKEVDEPSLDFDVAINDGAGQVILSVIDRDLDNGEYVWDFGDGEGAMGATVVHNYEGSGTYSACLMADDCLGNVIEMCKDFDVNVSTIWEDTSYVEPMDTMMPSALIEFVEYDVTIFPNPAIENIWIESDFNIEKITILDAVGKIVRQEDRVNSNFIEIDVQDLPNGLYFISIKSKNKIDKLRKLIVHK